MRPGGRVVDGYVARGRWSVLDRRRQAGMRAGDGFSADAGRAVRRQISFGDCRTQLGPAHCAS
jgi:hypothetical protein